MVAIEETKLAGNVTGAKPETIKDFLAELELLMEKYKVNKVDVSWVKFE